MLGRVLSLAIFAAPAAILLLPASVLAADCALVPYLSEDEERPPPFAAIAVSTDSPPLTERTGRLDLRANNSLMPSFDSDCGRMISAAVLQERVTLDVAQTEERPSFAALTSDLTPGGSPVTWVSEASYLAKEKSALEDPSRFVGARNGVGLLDGRLLASSDFGLSMDEAREPTGHASRYALTADLLRRGDLRLSGSAGFGLATSGYKAEGSEVTADRAVREIGAALGWGRWALDLEHSVATDNTEGDADKATNHWRVWRADLDIDLPELPNLLPQDLGLRFERETETADSGAGTTSDPGETASSYELDLSWSQREGATSLSLTRSDQDGAGVGGAGRSDSSYEIALNQDLRIADWDLSAEATWSVEAEREAGLLRRSRSLDLELDLSTAPFALGSLGLEGGTTLGDSDPHGPLEEVSVKLTYALTF